jgi:hypothetical protein
MTRTRVLTFALGVSIGLLVLSLVLRQGAATVQKSANTTGSDAAFIDEKIKPATLQSIISWAPDGPLDARQMEPGTRGDITVAYAQAWNLITRVGRGESVDLSSQFSLGALQHLTTFLDHKQVTVQTKHLSHVLTLLSYSDDGAIVTFSSAMKTQRVIGDRGHVIRLAGTDNLRVLMILEDGRWHIHAIERTNAT